MNALWNSVDGMTAADLRIALADREEHVAELMNEVLDQASDRQAVLARFLGTVSDSDTAFLSRLLQRRGADS